MTAGSHCRRPALTIHRRESLQAAARRMADERVGSLVIEDGGHVLGLLTDREVALRVVGGGVDAKGTRVEETLGGDAPLTLPEELPVSEAAREMRRYGVRRIPVVDEREKLVGVLSTDDLVRVVAEELTALSDVAAEQSPAAASRVVGTMPGALDYGKEVVTVAPDEPVAEVARRMSECGVGCVVVVDGTFAPRGVITERDLVVRVVAKDMDPEATDVADVVSRSPVCAEAEDRVGLVAKRMSEHGVRRVPIVQDGRLIGIVTYDDLLKMLGRELLDLGDAACAARTSRR